MVITGAAHLAGMGEPISVTRIIQGAVGVLFVAAVLGDQCNYTIGRYFGPKVFQWENTLCRPLLIRAAFPMQAKERLTLPSRP